ncbi:MAG: arsenite efflux transporter metallochaperone ArsD [Pedosphaera sp.]|nr:arsenite efflux transporter metallochaperone ArsD [Pedosphaera sp.]
MKTFESYDPPMCCSTGLCGSGIDPVLVNYAALLNGLGRKGVTIYRYNLGQQPMAFVQHPLVKALLDVDGVEVLPVVLVDGAVYLKGRYPTAAENEALLKSASAGADEGADISTE